MKRVLLQDLEGDVTLKSRILTTKHHAHTAFTQAFDDPIAAERLTDHVGSVIGWGANIPEVYSSGWNRASRLSRYRTSPVEAVKKPSEFPSCKKRSLP
jgi:hypothetical protein